MDTFRKSARQIEHDKNGNVTIHWNDDTTDFHRDPPHPVPGCRSCGTDVHTVDDFFQYNGFCAPCFVDIKFGVPYKLEEQLSTGIDEFVWSGQVNQTSNSERFGYNYGADKNRNNFGVGDTVKVGSEEATVLDIHEYLLNYPPNCRKYLAKVFLDYTKTQGVFPAGSLEALTCNHLDLDTSRFDDMLDNVSSTFDPMEEEGLRKIFRNPISKAIWMSYRQNHIMCKGEIEKLNTIASSIAYDLSYMKIPRDRVHLWFKREFSKSKLKMEDEQIAALVPYLVGRRKAHYHIEKKEVKVK